MPLGHDPKHTLTTTVFKRLLSRTTSLCSGFLLSAWVFGSANAATGDQISSPHVISYAAFLATLAFAVVSCFLLVRDRTRVQKERDTLLEQLADDRAKSERVETLIAADDQRLVIWPSNGRAPTVLGRLPDKCGAPADPVVFTGFGSWLDVTSAQTLEQAIDNLRQAGKPFQLAVRTQNGAYVDVYGRTVGGRVFIRFRDLSGDQQVLLELQKLYSENSADLNSFKALFEKIEQPVWLRKVNKNQETSIKWANDAYRNAVDSEADSDKLTELLDTGARAVEQECHMDGIHFSDRVQAVAAGNRRTFDVVSVPTGAGSVGIATDVTEEEKAQNALSRTIAAHERTFNELATAVVIFDKTRKLTFHNKAYRDLFGLSENYLNTQPSDSEVIDKLRTLGMIPVEANFREWKRSLLNSHQSLEVQEFTWHLPDGQTLRVLASPRNSGGITWIYENVTAQINLESRVNVLSRLQAETLNSLGDGVAVFSSDGRLTLSNLSFAEQWGLVPEELSEKAHINDLATLCIERSGNADAWHELKMTIVGVADRRTTCSGTMERPDGTVIEYATTSLIDGRTMVTFVEITDSINFERALTEKNDALEQADKLKSDFVQHVSYELRSPLTNIIGFAQLLSDADIGPLTTKQREYTDYILSSSSSLLAIINDILDLATADAGVLELSLLDISAKEAVDHAAEGLQDRLSDRQINLNIDIPDDIGTFIGDEKRIIQILFNLLSNAIRYSDDGSDILVHVRRENDDMIFTVQDWGAGISKTFLEDVFSRFESRKAGQTRGGAGLGLSIVKRFVELHNGSVTIDSEEGVGTKVSCRFPANPIADHIAAE